MKITPKVILRVFVVFISIIALASCNNKFNKVMRSKDYAYKLKKADEYYDKKKYRNAEALYVELFPVFKGTDKFENLYYRYAYCSYYQENYSEAGVLYKGFLEIFPTSAKSEEVAYMQAFCFYKESPRIELEQVNTQKVVGMMQTFINTHPGSARIKDATEIIDKCRKKLETKEYNNAALYYKLQQYRASAIAFTNLLNDYPEAVNGDMYKLMAIKSYYKFAQMSIIDKQQERYEKVITEYNDFTDRFPDSKLLKEAEDYNNLSLNHIKAIQNEQTQTSTGR
jgi:outer membrane protein assembly factor BamD